MNKDFTVLLSLYFKESPDFLRQSLDSINNQTVKPSQIVLVEDGPLTPELYNILEEYEKKLLSFHRVKLSTNNGLGRALNEGLKHCKCELIARMDTDDISVPTRFEKQLAVFEAYPQVEVVSSWIDEFIDSPNDVVSTRKLPEYPFEIFKFGKTRCPINHPAVMFKKEAVLLAGGYRHFPLFEDYYLWVRLLLNGVKFYNIQDSLLFFRTSKDMYKRRGGLRHAINEIRFQNHIRKIGYISWYRFMFNISIRFFTRIIPNNLRAYIYRTFLRN